MLPIEECPIRHRLHLLHQRGASYRSRLLWFLEDSPLLETMCAHRPQLDSQESRVNQDG